MKKHHSDLVWAGLMTIAAVVTAYTHHAILSAILTFGGGFFVSESLNEARLYFLTQLVNAHEQWRAENAADTPPPPPGPGVWRKGIG